ncbi:hypothetical protein ACLOJK_019091 [Asimina triloba]
MYTDVGTLPEYRFRYSIFPKEHPWPTFIGRSTPDLPWRSTSSPSGIIQRPSGHGSIKKSGREQKSPNGRHQTDLDSKQIDGENLI